MYDQYYGLKGRPFQLTPDPHFYFESATHRKAMSYLGYGLAQGEGFIVITGDIGAGKTTLVGHLMATIDPSRLTAVKIVSTQVEGDDMLRLTAQSFGLDTQGVAKAQILQRIEGYLHQQARAGRRTLLIVDEGQNLPISALEELRMLSNFQLGGQALLQIFLLGQPEFRDVLRSAPELEQLRQRVIATHHLEPMMANETEPYITHRLALVGWEGNPRFTPDAYAAMHQATSGVPRRLNALASRVLLLGAIDQLSVIDGPVVEAVIADMSRDTEVEAKPVQISMLDAVKADVPVEPVRAAGPVTVQPTQFKHNAEPGLGVAPDGPPMASLQDLHSIRTEIAELRRMFYNLPAPHHDSEAADRLVQLEKRVQAVELRSDEQEAALRRVLTLLVNWVERDEAEATYASRGQAA